MHSLCCSVFAEEIHVNISVLHLPIAATVVQLSSEWIGRNFIGGSDGAEWSSRHWMSVLTWWHLPRAERSTSRQRDETATCYNLLTTPGLLPAVQQRQWPMSDSHAGGHRSVTYQSLTNIYSIQLYIQLDDPWGVNRITYWSQSVASLPKNVSLPYPPLDNIRVMLIVWRLRRNFIRSAPCWVVWHNVHSQQHTHTSSSYRSSRLGLSHWDPYAMQRRWSRVVLL